MASIKVMKDDAKAVARYRMVLGVTAFVVVLVAGLVLVKWLPYSLKTVGVIAHRTLGPSITSGTAEAPTVTGWPAALGYAAAYYRAVWQALVLALVAGATLQVFVPRSWIHRLIGDTGFRSTAIAGGLSLIGMM